MTPDPSSITALDKMLGLSEATVVALTTSFVAMVSAITVAWLQNRSNKANSHARNTVVAALQTSVDELAEVLGVVQRTTGNTNQRVTVVQRSVDDNGARITDNSARISDNSRKIADNSRRIDRVQETVDHHDDKLAEHERAIMRAIPCRHPGHFTSARPAEDQPLPPPKRNKP